MFSWFERRAHLFVFVLICDSFAALYEGDKCSLNDANEGICRHIKECPTALQLIKVGVNPIICGFKGIEPIVCCKDGVEITNSTSTTTTTSAATSRKPGEISEQKCKEYAEYAYEKIYSPTLLLKPQFKKKLVCDIPRNKLKVGSTLALRREFPHMAVIGFKQGDEVTWQCGGSLISENFVLTAAHCTNSREGPAKVVRLGFTNNSDFTHMQERTVSETINYPKFAHTKYHDVGLLRLSKNVQFDTYVHPACLQTRRHIPYDLAISVGWGTADYVGEPISFDLLEVILEFIDGERCNDTYGRRLSNSRSLKDGIVDDLMICVGTTYAVETTCTGDSGGPLQVYHTETEEIKCMYDIVGINSFGISFCGLTPGSPTVHTRISHYIKWIEDIVWPN